MANLQADYLLIQQIGARLKDQRGGENGELMAIINQINSDLNTAQESWVGTAAESNAEQWQELLPKFRAAAEVVAELGAFIHKYGVELQNTEDAFTVK